jgi:hypothetical protein
LASWTDFAKELQGDVQSEIRADAPSLLHQLTNVATGGATVGIPGPGNHIILEPFWVRFRIPILGLGLLVVVWLLFLRK